MGDFLSSNVQLWKGCQFQATYTKRSGLVGVTVFKLSCVHGTSRNHTYTREGIKKFTNLPSCAWTSDEGGVKTRSQYITKRLDQAP